MFELMVYVLLGGISVIACFAVGVVVFLFSEKK